MRKFAFRFSLILSLATGCARAFQPTSASSESSPPALVGPYATQHFVFGTLGDSISRGFDIVTFGEDDLADSWSSGLSLPESHVNELTSVFTQKGWNGPIDILNLAVTGDTVLGSNSKLAGNAAQLAALNPDYVTLEIGANDICHSLVATPTEQVQFHDNVVAVLTSLTTSAHPPKVIAVASVPHIFTLTQIPEFAASSTCSVVWKLVCPNLQVGQAAFDAQWMAVNQALADAAAAVGGPVIFDGGAVAATNFTLDDVSQIDCFHPSTVGQGKLATLVWQTVASAVTTRIVNQSQ